MHTTKTAVCLQTMFVIKLNFVFSDYSFSEFSLYFHMIYMYNDPGHHMPQCMCSWCSLIISNSYGWSRQENISQEDKSFSRNSVFPFPYSFFLSLLPAFFLFAESLVITCPEAFAGICSQLVPACRCYSNLLILNLSKGGQKLD